jgi:HPt (histidine-containing phosphotransfer) domain-containing protein
MKGEAERCLEVGMNDYLPKPLQIPELAAKLHRWLPWQGRAPGAAAPPPAPAPAAAQDPDPVDRASLDAITGGDPVFARELLRGFAESYGENYAEIAAALDYRDHRRAAEMAHRLGGACAAVGALRLARLCTRVENAARSALWSALDELRPALEREVAALRSYLDAIAEGSGSSAV